MNIFCDVINNTNNLLPLKMFKERVKNKPEPWRSFEETTTAGVAQNVLYNVASDSLFYSKCKHRFGFTRVYLYPYVHLFFFTITPCAFHITVHVFCSAFQCVRIYCTLSRMCMCPYLHLPYSHPLLCEHSQRRVRSPGPHHVHSQAAVLKLLFRLQEWVSIQPDVSLQDIGE